jgi:AcrR family transcriptional regulator
MSSVKSTTSVRERLLQAADELFYREGVYTVGIDRILEHAGVAKASLYSTYGSKDELVRAYLDKRALDLRARIERRVEAVSDPRKRVVAVFDVLVDRVKAGGYFGCPFMRACAEAAATPVAAREAAAAFWLWRHELFVRLASEAGVRDAQSTARQLAMVYDGASVSASLQDGPGVTEAVRAAVERVLGDATRLDTKKQKVAPRTKSRRASVGK